MGRTFSFSLNFSGHRVQDISLTCGLRPISDIRDAAPTYGTDIEVPAVIEILDLLVSGVASAEEARDALIQVSTQVNEEQDREHERRLKEQDRRYARYAQDAPVQPQRPDSRWVYAVSSEDEPKVIKIGVASNVKNRMRGIQTGSASPVALRWSTRGGKHLEDHLHERFRERRLTGEWFDFRRIDDPVELISEAAHAFLADYELAE